MPWNPGQLVRHIDDPAKTGTITNQTRLRASGNQYRVRWDNGRLDWHYAEELVAAHVSDDDPLELIRAGRYGRVDDLRQLLTHIHLAGKLANVVYAMGLTQTDFYPHQYKPLLTLLDSPPTACSLPTKWGSAKPSKRDSSGQNCAPATTCAACWSSAPPCCAKNGVLS